MKKLLFMLLLSFICAISAIGLTACDGLNQAKDLINEYVNDNNQNNENDDNVNNNNSQVNSQPTSDEYFTFTLLDNDTYEIKVKDVNNMPAKVVIPATHLGSAVTSIGDDAFCDYIGFNNNRENISSLEDMYPYICENITEITIPDCIINIGQNAFGACINLTKITIPANVTTISDGAFGMCKSLTSITIPNGVTSIGNFLFEDCSSLTTITIPDSVTSIGNFAFTGCSSLTSITIPNGVTSIGSGAFKYCSSLTSITIPNNVDYIGNVTCVDCTSLTSITIGSGVTGIGYNAFSNCNTLTSIKFNGTKEQWNAIEKDNTWNYRVPATQVVCTNGPVELTPNNDADYTPWEK